MINKEGEGWILSTSVILMVMLVCYGCFLFATDLTSLLSLYNEHLIVFLIILAVMLIFIKFYLLFRLMRIRHRSLKSSQLEKQIAQIIWRQRYVLQSDKMKIMRHNTPANRKLWHQQKRHFIMDEIIPKLPEQEFSMEFISELIEKFIKGTSLDAIRPPTYEVSNSKQQG